MVHWESISEYSDRTGTTKDRVRQMIKSGLLQAESTDGGGKLMIKVESNDEVAKLKELIVTQDKKIDALCKHLGVQI
jgi:hypothetical protein